MIAEDVQIFQNISDIRLLFVKNTGTCTSEMNSIHNSHFHRLLTQLNKFKAKTSALWHKNYNIRSMTLQSRV